MVGHPTLNPLSVPTATAFSEEQCHILELYTQLQSMPAEGPDLVTDEEIESVIRSLPLKKAAGPDRLTNEHLKFGGPLLPTINFYPIYLIPSWLLVIVGPHFSMD